MRADCIVLRRALKPSALDRSRMACRLARLLENNEQSKQSQRGDQQELVIINISDDLRLLRDQGIERRSAGSSNRAHELCDGWVFEAAIDCGDICRDVGMVDLGHGGQERAE